MDAIDQLLRLLYQTAFKGFRGYFNFLEKSLRIVDPNFNLPSILKEGEGQSLDDRIAKIDSARENLQDAIYAIDELRRQAQGNKAELQDALWQLAAMEQKKSAANAELEALKKIAGADTEAFRRVVGIPTSKDIWRERAVGFGSGIIASIIASLIYAFVQGVI